MQAETSITKATPQDFILNIKYDDMHTQQQQQQYIDIKTYPRHGSAIACLMTFVNDLRKEKYSMHCKNQEEQKG
jgi:hypothetical protein